MNIPTHTTPTAPLIENRQLDHVHRNGHARALNGGVPLRRRPFSRKLQQRVKTRLEALYSALNGKHFIGREERARINALGHNTAYGELTYAGAAGLIRYLRNNPYIPLNRQRVFYDLGSGMGKVVIQLYLSYPLKKTVGIELSPTRSNGARQALYNLQNQYAPPHDGHIAFIEGDFLLQDLSDADYLYMCSTCYPDKVLRALLEKLAAYRKPMMILSHKALNGFGTGLREVDTLRVPVSWTSSIALHVYLVGDGGTW